MKRIKILLSLFVMLGLAGCTDQKAKEPDQKPSVTKVHTKTLVSQSPSVTAREEIKKRKDVSNVKAVNTDKELLVALEIEQFDRLHIKKTVKEVKSKLKKTFPNHKIEVTADSKIFLELDKLQSKIEKNKLDTKSLKKEHNDLKKLMKEKA
ncbi:YhcN/YlaJ family sporulation lipoprotein [Peribacillus psychrosaccharolyticus]|uniref:YhcN/YlaJ family sporulation lipoprotein n=1 Tax=Peribacillus psychrosaccharolyticus TaxID=1407 RepID=A0A974S0K6_PERPY|nr:YhcN/YlaJ family sporulation lipoprotein [Peribacillus psychrosaccharolyticus]MEC2056374.1 YhcN/YlaJ family sporulation lipoprotein [Peribacillus psychrosaccharolyticus]MED3743776.1 YhcN/YlaJ family sporulation lipoprotein [Peribacillus psychrosaccharolyticus]QQT00463.1 YhcN/YlaJ family sporulation lipoprotein [Peribacillus psychrosaccharolyticus]